MDFPVISQPVLSHAQPVEKNRVICDFKKVGVRGTHRVEHQLE